jgi:subfamily B ATP-binding cassette protein MsbA
MKNIRRILGLVKPYAGRFFLAILCLSMVTLCIVSFTTLIGPIMDNVWSNSKFNSANTGETDVDKGLQQNTTEKLDFLKVARDYLQIENILPEDWRQDFVLIPALLVIIFVFKGFFSYTGNYMMASVGQSVVRDIRNDLYKSILHKPISFFRGRSTGSLISRITNDIEKIQNAVSNNLADLIREALTVVGLAALVFYLNPTLAFISLVIAPLALIPIVQFGRRIRTTSKHGQEQMEGLTNRLHETFSGIRIVKAFCAEKQEQQRFKDENNRLLRLLLKNVKYFSLTSPVMEIIGSFGFAYMIYWGGLQISQGEMTMGIFSQILAALYGMYNPIKKLSRVNNNLQNALAAIDRVNDIMTIKDEIADCDQAIALTDFKDSIQIKEVDFSYGERSILKNISIDVKKGQVCAIVGLSGAGKTTLVNLLPRFDEVTNGAITIDGKNIKDFTLKSLRDNIGIVTQETILFNDTVKHNISYGQEKEISDEQIIAAAKAAHAHEFISKMEQGYETIIGEKGVKISGGERQRLAIARALVKNPPILILDEATSALDSESERLVQDALENLMSHRTTFVIAHRLSTVRKADRIVVLNEGNLVETGTHEELLALNGLYSKLHSLQFADTDKLH